MSFDKCIEFLYPPAILIKSSSTTPALSRKILSSYRFVARPWLHPYLLATTDLFLVPIV